MYFGSNESLFFWDAMKFEYGLSTLTPTYRFVLVRGEYRRAVS